MASSEKYFNFSKTRRSNLKGKSKGPTAFVYNLYKDCAGTEPVTLYSASAALIIGTNLYTDSGLTNAYDASIAVVGSGVVYRLNSNQIAEIYPCFSDYMAYFDCTQTSEVGTVYVEGGAYTTPGSRVSTNPEGTSPFSNQTFVIDGYTIITDASGYIDNVTSCGT